MVSLNFSNKPFGIATMTALVLACTGVVTDAASCSTSPWAKCGSNTDAVSCCPDGFYCVPWDASFFQCVQQPQQCTQQLTNMDLAGNDIKTIYGIQPSDCCTQCAQTAGCVAYTFVNSNPGQPACYLKSGVGERTTKVGAVSGFVNGASTPGPTTPPTPTTPTPTTPKPTTSTPTTTPPTNCATVSYGTCGDSNGATCCPSGQYCQPWNPTFYQCIPTPPRCSAQLTDTDFYGDDLVTLYVSLPSLCCEACAKTANCAAYTFINYNPGQPVCYLKSAAGAPTRLVGAVSGKLA